MNKLNGLGDLVYYMTTYTGIGWLMHRYRKATGFECNCMRRRKVWNARFPFK